MNIFERLVDWEIRRRLRNFERNQLAEMLTDAIRQNRQLKEMLRASEIRNQDLQLMIEAADDNLESDYVH